MIPFFRIQTIYDESIIKKLIESPYESAAVVAKYEQWMDGTVVVTDRNDSILNFIEKRILDMMILKNIIKQLAFINLVRVFEQILSSIS